MSVNLITGNLFSPIQASQDSDYQAGTFGAKTQILNVGSKMAVSIVDNSTIRCEDGVLVTREGRRIQIDNGDVVEWTIPTGTQGTTSYYIVGFRLYTDGESAQLCDTFVQSVAGPGATIAEDTFRDGAVEIFVSVARVVQNGITLESVKSLVPTAMTTNDLTDAAGRLRNEIDDINDSIRTNLLNPTAQTQTINGVTFTNNGDGTYTVNGTASAQTYIVLTSSNFDLVPFRGKDIKIAGCPLGGGADKYQFNINIYDESDTNIGGATRDYGKGAIIHIPNNAHHARNIVIAVQGGYTANNLLFKPMLTTDLNAKYSDYVPYTGDSGRLNEDVAEINGAISQINSDLSSVTKESVARSNYFTAGGISLTKCNKQIQINLTLSTGAELIANNVYRVSDTPFPKGEVSITSDTLNSKLQFALTLDSNGYLMIHPYSQNIPAETWLMAQINYIDKS